MLKLAILAKRTPLVTCAKRAKLVNTTWGRSRPIKVTISAATFLALAFALALVYLALARCGIIAFQLQPSSGVMARWAKRQYLPRGQRPKAAA